MTPGAYGTYRAYRADGNLELIKLTTSINRKYHKNKL